MDEATDTSGGNSSAPAKAVADTNSNATAAATVSTTVGDAAKQAADQSSASASVPATVGAPEQKATSGDFREGWGDDLKNDPSLKDFKDTQSLAKALIDTKKLVGQKLGIPGPDATPEAKAAFNEAMGVPKEGAGYEFKAPEGIPDKIRDALYSEEHSKEWAEFFREKGVPKEVANAIRDKFFQEMKGDLEELMTEVDKSDEEFGKMAAKIYGDNAKANAAIQNVKTAIEKHVPAELKGQLDKLSNSALLIIASTIRGETLDLSGEDKSLSGDPGVQGNDGKSVADLREEARTLQALPEYNNPLAKGKNAHDKLVAEVKSIYKRIEVLEAGKK